MATPVVAGRTNSGGSGIGTVAGLPTPVAAGDLLFMVCGIKDTHDETHTLSAGWVILAQSFRTIDSRIIVAYKEATGGETTVTITGTSWSESKSWSILRITGAEAVATQAPQISSLASPAFGTSVDPPSLTPTGGAKDYLWIACCSSREADDPSAAPASYSNLNTGTGSAMGATAERALNASSENPGAFTIGGSGSHLFGATVAIHPPPPPTIALTGTITDDTENEIRAVGDSTVILTITTGTWAASGATFNAERQGIIDGLVSAQAEGAGWDATVVPDIPVENVVRTSDTIVTITVPATGAYFITANETIEATIPSTAVVPAGELVATPTFDITDSALNVGSGLLFPFFKL